MAFIHIQGGTANTGGVVGTSFTIVLSNTPIVGNLVCVGIVFINATNTSPASISILDGNNNRYVITPNSPAAGTFPNAGSGGTSPEYGWLYLCYFLVTDLPSSQIIVTWANSMYAQGWAEEFSVSAGVISFDKDVAGTVQTASGTVANIPSITPLAANSLLYSVGCDDYNGFVAPTAGGTLGAWIGGAGGPDLAITGGNTEYDLAATGSTSVNYTCGVSGDIYIASAMSFYTMPTEIFPPDMTPGTSVAWRFK